MSPRRRGIVNPAFSVIVCTYNGQERIAETLNSLFAQRYASADFEVIVVDDGSQDQTVEIVKTYPRVRLVQHPKNVGLSTGRNTGLAAARGKWVAFIDDDCTADRNWLRHLETALRKERTLGVASLIEPKRTKTIGQRYMHRSGYGQPARLVLGQARSPLGRVLAYVKDKFTEALRPQPTEGEVQEVYGASGAFPADKLRKAGGYDLAIRSAEDREICARLHAAFPDDTFRFAPKAKMKHDFLTSFVAHVRKIHGRQGDTLTFYSRLGKMPPLFPFPFGVLAAGLLSIPFVGWYALAVWAAAPLLFYPWWTVAALRFRNVEYAWYAYMQLFEEAAQAHGLLAAWWRLPRGSRSLLALLGATIPIFVVLAILQPPLWRAAVVTFLLVIPGSLLLQALRVQLSSLRSFCLAVAASIGVLLATALGVNTLVQLHSGLAFTSELIVGALTLVSVALWALAWRRRIDASWYLPRATVSGVMAAAMLACLPVAGATASLYLNQTGNNWPSVGLLCLIAGLGLVAVLRGQKLPAKIIPLVLFSVGLTILLMGAFRGDVAGGTDIAKELYLFGLTQQAGSWAPSLYNDAYNACISITVLPLALTKLLYIDVMTVFRVIVPLAYSLVPVMIYALYRRRVSNAVALLAAMFFVAQPAFLGWSTIPIRQMIGFLFFGALLMTALEATLSSKVRYALVVFFGAGMVGSHYSTAYIALAVLFLGWFLLRSRYVRSWPQLRQKVRPGLTLPMLLSILAIAIIWYGPVTHASTHLSSLARQTWSSLGKSNPFSSDAHSQQTSLWDQLSFKSEPRETNKVWQDYLVETKTKYQGVAIDPLATQDQAAAITPRAVPEIAAKDPQVVSGGVQFIGQLVRKLTRLFLVIGLGVIIYNMWRRRSRNLEMQTLSLAAGVTLLMVILVPHASIDYDVVRTTQQLLPLLALPTMMGGLLFFKFGSLQRLGGIWSKRLLGLVIVAFFIFQSGLVTQAVGGAEPSVLLHNTGNSYNQLYVHQGEVAAAKWLNTIKGDTPMIQAGYFGGSRLWLGGVDRPVFYNDVLPWTIDQHGFLYASYAETVNHTATIYQNGSFVHYEYPAEVDNKNKVYTNGQATIYK